MLKALKIQNDNLSSKGITSAGRTGRNIKNIGELKAIIMELDPQEKYDTEIYKYSVKILGDNVVIAVIVTNSPKMENWLAEKFEQEGIYYMLYKRCPIVAFEKR